MFKTHDSSPFFVSELENEERKKIRRYLHVYYFVMFVLENETKTEWNMKQTEKMQRK